MRRRARSLRGAPPPAPGGRPGVARSSASRRSARCSSRSRRTSPFNMSEEEWDSVVAVHLKGHFTVMRPATKHMRERRYGRIVTFTSTEGLEGSPGQPNQRRPSLGGDASQLGEARILTRLQAYLSVDVRTPLASTSPAPG